LPIISSAVTCTFGDVVESVLMRHVKDAELLMLTVLLLGYGRTILADLSAFFTTQHSLQYMQPHLYAIDKKTGSG